MTKEPKGPGKSYRKGISLIQALQQFGDDAQAEAWFASRRWPTGIRCPKCDSDAISTRKGNRQTPQYHCKACTSNFTVKTGTIMHDSKLTLSKWALAFYLYSTNLKGVSSMKLHRDLGITQKSAWHLAHRIRETWNDETEKMAGPVEADETYIGGKEANKHESKKLRAGRGTVGKTPVVGVKDRETNRISTEVLESADQATLQNFVIRHTEPKAQVYTDEAAAYRGIPRAHEAVSHSAKEYVRGMAHTNGMESHWAMFKRGLDGVYHHVSVKHLGRYTTEFQGRHNNRPLDTADQMGIMVANADGKRLTYATLIGSPETRRPRML